MAKRSRMKSGGVGAVVKRVRAHRISELILLKDPSVLGKVTEQQAGEEDVQPVAVLRVFHQAWVGGGELVEKLAHLFSGLDISMRLGGVLGLLHPCPRQEERKVLINLTQRKRTVLRRFEVVGDHVRVVGHDGKAGGEFSPPSEKHADVRALRGGPLGLADVDDVLLRDFTLRVIGDIQRTVPEPSDISLGAPVRSQQVEDELTVVLLLPSQGLDSFLDRFQGQSCHYPLPSWLDPCNRLSRHTPQEFTRVRAGLSWSWGAF